MRKIKFLAALLAIAAASPALATNGMRMIGFGPVQNSMGGASAATSLDGAVMASNPAGLADVGGRFDFAGTYFKPTVSYSATGIAPPFVNNPGATLDSNRGASPIPTIAYVKPLNDQFTVGVGVFGTSGMGVDYPANLFSGVTYTSYMQGRLTPAVAYKLNDWISAGVTLNLMLAQMKYDVASGFNQSPHNAATSFGYGATVGVKARLVKMLAIGAAYETKSSFQDFSFDLPTGTDKLTFDQPMTATFGVEVTPIEMLLVAADVQWINWSDTMGQGLPKYSQNNTGSLPFNMNWSDQWVMKLGVQASPTRSLQLRAGYNYGKMPLDPTRAFENMAFPAVAEHHVTAGVGYAFSPTFTVNVGAMYALNAKLTGSNGAPPNPDGSGGQGITSYTTEMSQFELDMGIAYRF